MNWITLNIATEGGPIELELSSLSTVRRVIMETLGRLGYPEGHPVTAVATLVDSMNRKLDDDMLIYEIEDPSDLWLTWFQQEE